MLKNPKILISSLTAAAIVIVALALTLQGGIPDNAVATVGGDSVTRAEFDRFANIISASQGNNVPISVNDAPKFVACVKAKRKGAPKMQEAELRRLCKIEFDARIQQIMTSLIQQKWYLLEADDQGIKVGKTELEKRYQMVKKQAFPSDKEFRAYMAKTKQNEDNLREIINFQIVAEKLRQKAMTAKSAVTQEDIKKHYKKNIQSYAQPVTRNIRVLITKTEAKATAAKAALAGGASWEKVAKKYSIDPATKGNGGKFKGVRKNQFDKIVGKAVFKAGIGNVTGPIKSPAGFFVFEVEAEIPAKQQTLKEVTPIIKQTLAAETQQKAMTAFIARFEEKWKGKTECREGFVVPNCDNAPKPKPAPQPPGLPGGGADGQQQAPPPPQ